MKKDFQKRILILTVILMVAIGTVSLTYIHNNSDIKIGLVLGLSGKWSQLGVDISNGVLLAINKTNAQGGILGKKIKVLIYDHKSTLEGSKALIDKIKKDNVHLIIGFDTSAMTPLYEQFNKSGTFLFISPTLSTTELGGLDDNIVRVIPENTVQADALWGMIEEDSLHKLSVVVDSSNKAYSEPIMARLESLSKGSSVAYKVHAFQSLKDDVRSVAPKLLKDQPDGIIFVTNALTTATICQNLKKLNYTGFKYVSAWGMTSELVQNGGNSVEQLRGIGFFNLASNDPNYLSYAADYKKNYNSDVPVFSIFGYDAAMTLIQGIQESKSTMDLSAIKKSMLLKRYHGVQSNYTLDEFGDCEREFIRYHIEKGQFIAQ